MRTTPGQKKAAQRHELVLHQADAQTVVSVASVVKEANALIEVETERMWLAQQTKSLTVASEVTGVTAGRLGRECLNQIAQELVQMKALARLSLVVLLDRECLQQIVPNAWSEVRGPIWESAPIGQSEVIEIERTDLIRLKRAIVPIDQSALQGVLIDLSVLSDWTGVTGSTAVIELTVLTEWNGKTALTEIKTETEATETEVI